MSGFGTGLSVHLTQVSEGGSPSGIGFVYREQRVVDIHELLGAAKPEDLRKISLGDVLLFEFRGDYVSLFPSIAMRLDGRWIELGVSARLHFGHIYHLQIAFLHFDLLVQREAPLDIYTHRT